MIHLNKYVYTTAIVGAMLFTGCAADEDTTKIPDTPEDTAVRFISKVETRATASSFDANDAIGIYMIKTGTKLTTANIMENTANRQYVTPDKSTFKPIAEEQTVYFPKDNSVVDFISYYPFSEQVTATFTLPINVADQSKQASIDLLYSNNAKRREYTNPSTELVFKHQLARLHFVLKPGKGLTDELMKGATVTLKGMNTQADFSLATGELAAKVSEKDIAALTSADGKTAEAIVLPSKGEGKQFVFKVNNEPFYYNLTASDVLVSGEQYTYNVTLNRIENSVTGEIENWTVVERNIEVEP